MHTDNSSNTKAVDLLREARALISDPDKWTQGTLARNAYGSEVASYSHDACKWCVAGAMLRVADSNDVPYSTELSAHSALVLASRELFGSSAIEEVNDTRTHADVLALFDRAIELASNPTE